MRRDVGECGALPLRRGPSDRRLRVGVRRRTPPPGSSPRTPGRPASSSATTPERMRQLRRAGAEAAFATLLGSAAPELVDRVLGAGGSTSMRGWRGVPGAHPAAVGPRVGAGRRRRLLQGPDHRPRHHRRSARRRAARGRGSSRHWAGGSRGGRARGYQATRDRLSTQLFAATEEVAGYELGRRARSRELLRTVSSAMSDEVDHLQATSGRLVGPGMAAFLPTDNAHSRWVTWLRRRGRPP